MEIKVSDELMFFHKKNIARILVKSIEVKKACLKGHAFNTSNSKIPFSFCKKMFFFSLKTRAFKGQKTSNISFEIKFLKIFKDSAIVLAINVCTIIEAHLIERMDVTGLFYKWKLNIVKCLIVFKI